MNNNRTILVLALGVFGIATTEFGVIGILPDLASAFKVSINIAGLLLSTFAIIVALFGPFMMIGLSRFDRKNLMAFSLLIFTTANVLSVFATNFYWLLIIRMLPAFFHPVYWSIALSLASKSVATENASKAVSTVFSGLTIATVLGVPIATFISDLLNWQYSFAFSAFINLISLVGLLFFLPRIESNHKEMTFSKKEILTNKLLWCNIILAFFIITAMYSTYGYMADYLKQVSNMNGKEISLMLLLFGATGIGGNKLAGKYMWRFPNLTTGIFILLLIICHILLYLFGSKITPVIFIVTIWGFVHSAGFLISNISVTNSVHKAPEFINSIFTSCGNIAVTAGSITGGFWISTFGIKEVIWPSIICLTIALLSLLIKRNDKFSTIIPK